MHDISNQGSTMLLTIKSCPAGVHAATAASGKNTAPNTVIQLAPAAAEAASLYRCCGRNDSKKARRINKVHWVVADIPIQVRATILSNWISTEPFREQSVIRPATAEA